MKDFPIDKNSTGASVIVGVPTYGMMYPETVFSLLALILRGGPLVHDLDYRSQLYIDLARNSIVRKAIDPESPKLFGPAGRKSTHLLFLDADMDWPSDIISRLVSHRKPVVSGIYFLKHGHHDPVAGDLARKNSRWELEMWGPARLPNRGSKELVKLDGPSTGCVLIELDVFRKMKSHFGDENWFRSQETGEDLHFFGRLKDMGVPCFVDTSVECGHWGRHRFTRSDYEHAKSCPMMESGPDGTIRPKAAL